MFRFYQRRGWTDALRFFANIDEDEKSVAARVGAAMRELLADLPKENSRIFRADFDCVYGINHGGRGDHGAKKM
jgi:hypothetical protein